MTISYILAKPDLASAVIAMLPRLAEFDHPPRLAPEDFWRGDAAAIEKWRDGHAPDCFLLVARSPENNLAGAAFVRLMPEIMSQHPSAHLETLTVAQGFEGRGVGAGLVEAAEAEAKSRGALSITLNVFNRNHRAKQLYERLGFTSEIHLYIKPLD